MVNCFGISTCRFTMVIIKLCCYQNGLHQLEVRKIQVQTKTQTFRGNQNTNFGSGKILSLISIFGCHWQSKNVRVNTTMSVLTPGQAQIVSVASRGHNLLITGQAWQWYVQAELRVLCMNLKKHLPCIPTTVLAQLIFLGSSLSRGLPTTVSSSNECQKAMY